MIPERIKEIKQKYLLNNPDKRRESCKKYYGKNKEKIREWGIKYRKTEKCKMMKLNCKYKRRAKEKETDITKEWLLDLKARTFECMMCDCKLTDENRQLDHIIPLHVDGTHTKDNVRYVCRKCNQTRPKDGRDEEQSLKRFMKAFLDPSNWGNEDIFYMDIHASI